MLSPLTRAQRAAYQAELAHHNAKRRKSLKTKARIAYIAYLLAFSPELKG